MQGVLNINIGSLCVTYIHWNHAYMYLVYINKKQYIVTLECRHSHRSYVIQYN